jgi:hypothetical protein
MSAQLVTMDPVPIEAAERLSQSLSSRPSSSWSDLSCRGDHVDEDRGDGPLTDDLLLVNWPFCARRLSSSSRKCWFSLLNSAYVGIVGASCHLEDERKVATLQSRAYLHPQTYIFTSPRTMTISRVQASASPRLMHVEHGTVLSHLTFRVAQERQLRGARCVVRNGESFVDR